MRILKHLIATIALILIPLTSVWAQTASSALVDTINKPTQTMLTKSGLGNFSLGVVIKVVIQGALSLLGIVFLVIIVFAGYRWMTAAGNEDSIKKSQDMIKRAIIGLVIIFMAYGITYFVFRMLPFSGGGQPPVG